MKLKHVFLFSFGLIVIWLSVSCQSGTKPTIATSPPVAVTSTTRPQSSLMPTLTAPLPTATATIKVEKTSDSVLEPTSLPTVALETATPFPLLSTPTITTVTLTPLPTFTAHELEGAEAELLENPMNCDVPCWWGAIPGETTFFEIQQFLDLYQLTDYVRYLEQEDPDKRFELWMGFDEKENLSDYRVRYAFNNNVLISLITEQAPSLVDITGKYGQPDEVWLSAMNDPRQNPPLLWFVAVYLHKGLGIGSVLYGDVQDNVLIGCFSNEERSFLNLVPPNKATSYKDFATIYDRERLYLSVTEATGLTLEDFTQHISDTSQPRCIETARELWK